MEEVAEKKAARNPTLHHSISWGSQTRDSANPQTRDWRTRGNTELNARAGWIRSPRSTVTGAVALHLANHVLETRRLGDLATARVLEVAARKLMACVRAYLRGGNHRCSSPLCPAGQTRTAKKHLRKAEQKRLQFPGSVFAFLTLTVTVDDVSEGLDILTAAFSKLRSRRSWSRVVAGGAAGFELKPTEDGSARPWNVHTHVVAQLHPGKQIDAGELAADWTQLLAHHGVRGHAHVIPQTRAPVRPRKWKDRQAGRLFWPAGFYAVKRKRSELLDYDAHQLTALVRALPKRRLVVTFGAWRGKRRNP